MLPEKKKFITVFTPCFNEEDNVEKLIEAVSSVFKELPQYEYEHLFIDNHSTDNTVKILKRIAETRKRYQPKDPMFKACDKIYNEGDALLNKLLKCDDVDNEHDTIF